MPRAAERGPVLYPGAASALLPLVVQVRVVAPEEHLEVAVGVTSHRETPGPLAGQVRPARPPSGARRGLRQVVELGVVADEEDLKTPVGVGCDDWIAVPGPRR